MKFNKKFLKLLLMLFAFAVIYTPNFSSNAYLNYILPYIYMVIAFIFLKPINKEHKIKGKYFYITILIALWILATIFFAIRALIAGVELIDIVNLRIVQSGSIIVTIISICKIVNQLEYWEFSNIEKLKFLLNVTMIQAIIVIAMLVLPDLRTVLLSHFYQYGNGNEFTMSKRVYGIMSNYTFASPIFHGLLASVALTAGVLYDKKLYYYIPFLLLMIVFNGRTGMLIFILGVAINFIYFVLKNKYLKKAMIGLTAIILLSFISLWVIKNIKPDTYNFLIAGIEDVVNYIFYNEKDGNIEVLSENATDNINTKTFLFGNGHKIQNSGDIPPKIQFDASYSDMGYLNDMYLAGVAYMALLYIPMFWIILKKSKNIHLENKEKCISEVFEIIAVLTVILSNFKGEVFRSSIIIASIIYLRLILSNEEKKNEESISDNVNIQNTL